MKHRIILVIMVCMLFGVATVHAQSGGGYDLNWTNIDASGGTISGEAYSLVNVIAQPDAGAAQNGGDYSLTSGLIDAGNSGGITHAEEHLYLPLINR